MYIQPNTDIVILKNIPLENTYEHTIYFETSTAQYNYFYGKRKYVFSNNSYQRVNNNTMRLGTKVENLYDCNYLMFRNSSFGNRWFFAFILAVNYVSNEVCEIVYELDVIQSWFFTYNPNNVSERCWDFEDCFVERTHTPYDVIGEEIQIEPFEFGDYVQENCKYITPKWDLVSDTYKIVFIVSYDLWYSTDGGQTFIDPVWSDKEQAHWFPQDIESGERRDNVYNPMFYKVFDDITDANNFLSISVIKDQIAGILSVFMLPNSIPTTEDEHELLAEDWGGSYWSETYINWYNRVIEKPYNTIDKYEPRNYKLFTYPYKYLNISTDSGDGVYKYELFNREPDPEHGDEYCLFKIFYSLVPSPNLMLVPTNYGSRILGDDVNPDGEDFLFNNSMVIDGFPECAILTDAYKVYYAQNKASINSNIGLSVGKVVVGAGITLATGLIGASVAGATAQGAALASGASSSIAAIAGSKALSAAENTAFARSGLSAVKQGTSALGTIVNTIATKKDLQRLPSEIRGTQSSQMDYAVGSKNFIARFMCLKAENAARLDRLFDMFGYQVNKVMKPVLKVRDKWTYIKTVNCAIKGSIPADDVSIIDRIFDKGITWWVNGNDVGNYVDLADDNTAPHERNVNE